MTIIMGFNLSDRVYVAADTRVSRYINGTITPYHDNMLKIANLEGVLVACAGDAGLASHVIKSLSTESFTRRGVDSIRQQIESWIAPVCDSYWSELGHTTHATFILAGRSTYRRKRVEREKLITMLNTYREDSDIKGKVSESKMQLFDQMFRDKENRVKTSYSDTVLFAVNVSHQGVHIEETEWGQHLIYGPPGLKRGDIGPSQVARLEFEQGDDGHETNMLLLTAYFYDLVKKKGLEGVGQDVVVACAANDGDTYTMFGDVHVKIGTSEDYDVVETISSIQPVDGRIHRKRNGKTYPLLAIADYRSDGSLELIL